MVGSCAGVDVAAAGDVDVVSAVAGEVSEVESARGSDAHESDVVKSVLVYSRNDVKALWGLWYGADHGSAIVIEVVVDEQILIHYFRRVYVYDGSNDGHYCWDHWEYYQYLDDVDDYLFQRQHRLHWNLHHVSKPSSQEDTSILIHSFQVVIERTSRHIVVPMVGMTVMIVLVLSMMLHYISFSMIPVLHRHVAVRCNTR